MPWAVPEGKTQGWTFCHPHSPSRSPIMTFSVIVVNVLALASTEVPCRFLSRSPHLVSVRFCNPWCKASPPHPVGSHLLFVSLTCVTLPGSRNDSVSANGNAALVFGCAKLANKLPVFLGIGAEFHNGCRCATVTHCPRPECQTLIKGSHEACRNCVRLRPVRWEEHIAGPSILGFYLPPGKWENRACILKEDMQAYLLVSGVHNACRNFFIVYDCATFYYFLTLDLWLSDFCGSFFC